MRARNARSRWILVALLAAAPSCLFRPIFHPPSDRGPDASADAAAADVGVPFDSATGTDASYDAPVAFDASTTDTAPAPQDDCSDYFDHATGMYFPDAHHADGALCELPSADGGGPDASEDVVPDANDDVTPSDDAASDGATADDAATDDASDDAAPADAPSDDAMPADPDAGV